MSVIFINPYRFGVAYDADAQVYFDRVEGVNGDNQPLETAVKDAINAFVVGCKSDGIWNAIKASCILAGARTLNGALQPLVGAAPTNVGPFVSGDYNRKTGLVGNGSTKYLDSNRNNNADPQNSRHLAVYVSSAATTGAFFVSQSTFNVGGDSFIYQEGTSIPARTIFFRSSSANTFSFPPSIPGIGLMSVGRSDASTLIYRINGSTASISNASTTSLNGNTWIFGTSGFRTNARLAFYSIGEALDLALLDARVTTLINAFAAAIP